ncbi:MAG TPA: zinc ribbon domain-containing protein [Ktedonosporobacter sp.]|nr:zinc ribbon domain-containing protein [Ktedonosporobacter sp.]
MQPIGRICANCGAPLSGNQAFCERCGAPADATKGGTPTAMGTPPPPPPPLPQTGPYGGNQPYPSPPFGRAPERMGQEYPRPAPPFQEQPVPAFAQPPKDSSKKVLGQIGCGFLAIILLVLAICGGVSYGGYVWLKGLAQSASATTTASQTQTNSTSSQVNNDTTATPAAIPAKTVPINLTVTYASNDITILSIQQATSLDGDRTNTTGVLRLNLKEANNGGARYLYSDVAHLILPDHSSIPDNFDQHYSPPDKAATQTNWLDFALPTSTAVDQLVLRLGTTTEAQMDIPLKPQADVSMYKPKTVTPGNAQTTYDGVKWTITSATLQWSADGAQADTGKRYVTLQMRFDNNSSQSTQGYYGDYVRLKAGDSTNVPTGNTTIPLSFGAGQTGQTGQVSFLVPQGVTSFTLVLLGNTTGVQQATIDFQIS